MRLGTKHPPESGTGDQHNRRHESPVRRDVIPRRLNPFCLPTSESRRRSHIYFEFLRDRIRDQRRLAPAAPKPRSAITTVGSSGESTQPLICANADLLVSTKRTPAIRRKSALSPLRIVFSGSRRIDNNFQTGSYRADETSLTQLRASIAQNKVERTCFSVREVRAFLRSPESASQGPQVTKKRIAKVASSLQSSGSTPDL